MKDGCDPRKQKGNTPPQVRRTEVADVESVPDHYTRIGPELPVHLPLPHVKRVNSRSAVLKQAVGEPARGGSQIGTHSTRHGDLKMIQRTLKLAAALLAN